VNTTDTLCGVTRNPDGSGTGRPCMAGGYVHLAKFHEKAVAAGRAKTDEAMSR
jgi:hypothetical protein